MSNRLIAGPRVPGTPGPLRGIRIGDMRVNPDADPIVQDLIRRLNTTGKLATEVSVEAGYDLKTISRWNTGKVGSPGIRALRDVLQAAGLGLKTYVLDEEPSDG